MWGRNKKMELNTYKGNIVVWFCLTKYFGFFFFFSIPLPRSVTESGSRSKSLMSKPTVVRKISSLSQNNKQNHAKWILSSFLGDTDNIKANTVWRWCKSSRCWVGAHCVEEPWEEHNHNGCSWDVCEKKSYVEIIGMAGSWSANSTQVKNNEKKKQQE